MVINNKNKLIKYLFFYRSFLCYFVKFESTLEDRESKEIITALNIKSRYKRIYYLIDKLCNEIDIYYSGENICGFSKGVCRCHKKLNLNYKNGCCRKCMYQTNNGCSTKNFACKMFNCSYVKCRNKFIKYEDLSLLKVLTPLQRMVLKKDYFSSIEEVSRDLYFGPLYSIFRMIFRSIKTVSGKYVFTKK